MSDGGRAHLSDEQLALLQDGELAQPAAAHVERCAECAERLRDLREAEAAYAECLGSIAGAGPAPRPWTSLSEWKRARESRSAWRRWAVPALAAAACLLAALAFLLRRPAGTAIPDAGELLASAAQVETPAGRTISMRVRRRERVLVRPAVLVTGAPSGDDPELARLERLFDEARYSWREPLSARSFQQWRGRLAEKRDEVSVIRYAAAEPAYRVRTETSTGRLRSAALTLRARDLRPTRGDFAFAGEPALEIGEIEAPPSATARPQEPPAPRAEPVVETPASPADALHVLAALNRIGADAGEPVAVTVEAGRVLVRASGLAEERRQEVTETLRSLPRVRLELDAATPDRTPAMGRSGPARPSTAVMPGRLRQELEARLGGAAALQEITDRALDASGEAVARAHAVGALARLFPPPTESALAADDGQVLRALRRGHVEELQRSAGRIRAGLKPALPAAKPVPETREQPWQAQAAGLIEAAQRVDESLNRLLAGSYSQASGEALLRDLSERLDRLDRAIAAQQRSGW
jgi:hypothetical protein